jgi:hypothetical protein
VQASMGDQQHWHFCTVLNPMVCAMAQEKAGSCNAHPNMLTQVGAMDKGIKQKLSEKKVDILSTKSKWQHKEGQLKVIKYFDDTYIGREANLGGKFIQQCQGGGESA